MHNSYWQFSLKPPYMIVRIVQIAGLHVSFLASAARVSRRPAPFSRDVAAPDANGRPHYSTASGKHLYYSLEGAWTLHTKFMPHTLDGASYSTVGEVPQGESVWRYRDQKGDGIEVMVQELSAEAEKMVAAGAVAAFKQADMVRCLSAR